MDLFTIPVTLRNWQNMFLTPERQGEEIFCDAAVNTGSMDLALPVEYIQRLKLHEIGQTAVLTADGGQYVYRVFGMVEVEIQGRRSQVRALELPRGAEPLLGRVPLAAMGWCICVMDEKLIPDPRSPDMPMVPLL